MYKSIKFPVLCKAFLLFLIERQGKSEPAAGDDPTAETESESEAELSGFSPVVRAQRAEWEPVAPVWSIAS